MNFVTENITPAKAQQYLQTSIGNRPISKSYVKSYADTMKKGKWLLNGVCIVFDQNGHLIDGHHRLLAVIEAGIPVRFDVSRGAPEGAFTTFDNGRHRTVGQLLAMQNVKNYNLVGSIVLANETLVRTGRLNSNNARSVTNKKRTNEDNYEAYRRDPDGFNSAAQFMVKLQGRCRIIASSWAGGLYYYLTHTGGYTEDETQPFFEAIFSLDTSDIPVCDMLRKAITKAKISGKSLDPEFLWAFLVKAWNHYITKTTPKILKFSREEGMPKLKLKGL